MGMQCDVSPEQATPVVYTGYGVLYNSIPLMPLPTTGVLVTNTSTAITSRIVPPPSNLTTGGVYGITVGGPCRVDSDTSYMTCPSSPKNDTAEQ
jgi:hypothetical protein